MTLMIDEEIIVAFPHVEHVVSAVFEHGRWWVVCDDCAAQWSVHNSNRGFDYEQVTDGDEFCLSKGEKQ